MADLLQRGSDWLEEKRKLHASRMVTYLRSEQSVTLPASIGKTVYDVDDGYGVLVRHDSRDFLVLAADLVLDGQPVLPERGDRIREAQGGTTFVYEVAAPGKEPCWRYSDPYRKTIRVHTQQINTEAVP